MTRSLLLAFSLSALVFSACSEKTPTPTTEASETANGSAAAHISEKKPVTAPARFLTYSDVITINPEYAPGTAELPTDDDGRPLAYAMLGKSIPEFTLTMRNGETVTHADLEGLWTVIDFWGLWCGDCVVDAPYASALRTALAQDPDVQFLGIHMPPSAARADEAFGKWGSLNAYFSDKGGDYNTGIDADAAVRDAFDIYWAPTYLLITPDLKILAFRTDLHVDDSDGIKPIVQQIAELRRGYQAAAVDTGVLPSDE
ncbi:MAG: hypothetical protein CME88_01220 [Hirschia sp.]|nr:hypothetical protein [Hirschia sp.]MBF16981.1 hypothetical protein [Hirschia sp.]|tara:strand:+ start:1452 stop:2222 length:771 start_codon:yes stop_codon:yes gene_type:complete